MISGLIEKAAVTPANVSDQDTLKYICPQQGMVFGDKAYCLEAAQITMSRNNCHSGAVLKKHMKQKNRDKDKWLSRTRAPFEGVFSKLKKKARYRSLAKTQMQAFLETIVFNIKRLLVIQAGTGVPIALIECILQHFYCGFRIFYQISVEILGENIKNKSQFRYI